MTDANVGQALQKSNLACIMSRKIHIKNFKSMSEKIAEKVLKTKF